jgi:hypothetical protein
MRTFIRPAALAFAVLLAFGALAGCGGKGNAVKQQNYPGDGFLGMTNTNPHIPGRHMALNYESDKRFMWEAIRDVPGVAGMSVTFNGADAYVTIKQRPDVSPRDVPTVERQAAAVLRFNFPRYNIYVKSIKP